MLRFVTSLILGFGLLCSFANGDEILFSTQIRPTLSDKCFQCHGPDQEKRAAGLRLDEENSAKSILQSGSTAIVPGSMSESAIIARITSTDPDLQMPPPESGKHLSEKEVSLLMRWVESGAKWGKHWAFEPVARPNTSARSGAPGVQNEIDEFINAKLTDAGVVANSEAKRTALLRRVSLDLTGFPPTYDEVEAFRTDTSPSAYESVVDRLLKSPRYGEHMARYWLDAARYGDTHGLHLDNYREMWAYRDWVVNAFNDNMPFDQFTLEQLAGDLLPNPTDAQLIATGFNRCHVTTGEGGSIDDEVEVRNTVDRVVTTGAVFMGLTLDCCRCHSHKFDPITIQDFYSLYGFFNSIDGNPLDGNTKDHAPTLKVLTSEQKSELERLECRQLAIRKQIDQIIETTQFQEPEIPAEPVLTEPTEFIWVEDSAPAAKSVSGNTPWQFVKSPAPVYSGQTSHTRTATGLSQHYFEDAESPVEISEGDILVAYVFVDPSNSPDEIMLQWNDGSSWNHRAYWGKNSIDWGENDSASRLRKGDLPTAGKWIRLEVLAAEVGLISGSIVSGWAFTQFGGTVHWDHCGVVSRKSQRKVYDSLVRWERDQKSAGAAGLPLPLQAMILNPELLRDSEQALAIRNYFLQHAYVKTQETLTPRRQEMESLKQQIQAVHSQSATTLIFRERKQIKPVFVLNRGEYDQPREQVQRGVPAIMPPLPDGAPKNRLGLALWLTSTDHPLTSRVNVNRFLQQFFGIGLVRTSEDFGSQGEQPTHPELLDWLSSEFMRPQLAGAAHSWDVKHLIRTIVMSATYRRDAKVTNTLLRQDPANRLLARGARFRLDAETLRDQALFVSGLYVEQLGGPSLKPPQPDGLWQAVGYSGSNTVRFEKDHGHEKVHRRTLYTFIKRTAPPPQLAIMDAPSRESCVLRRERTNSPMQALMLMNDPQFVECARAMAERAMTEGGDSHAHRIRWMTRQCLQREPTGSELADLLGDFDVYRNDFRGNPESARKLIHLGELPPAAGIAVDELAAWTMIANTLLNLDETITK